MKKIIFFFTLIFFSLNVNSQDIGFKNINSWIEGNLEELIPIRIEFNYNIDCFKINQQFKDQQTPIN
jgi:hypothetical protein